MKARRCEGGEGRGWEVIRTASTLPWKAENATLETVLAAIFREPGRDIRAAVLDEYLRLIPVAEFDRALDLCIQLEGQENPNKLVSSILEVWAERDPQACWNRTKKLFRLTMEYDWLTYDHWADSKITVYDLDAVRASSFWLTDRAFGAFPLGVEKSSAGKEEQVRILKEFAALWFEMFGTWPWAPKDEAAPGRISEAFEAPLEKLPQYPGGWQFHEGLRFEIAMRRWLRAKPADAPEIVKWIRTQFLRAWPGAERGTAQPSTELFVIWAGADLPGMIRWAESLDHDKDVTAPETLGFLMSRVDAGTRQRWIAEAKKRDEKEEEGSAFRVKSLLRTWAGWDPATALEFALQEPDPEIIQEIATYSYATPFGDGASNTYDFGLGVIREFDASRVPKVWRDDHYEGWEMIMESWGDVDIGEAARYGVDFLLRYEPGLRNDLIKLFSGDDDFARDGDMTDRTFCALRVWAVMRPQEMKPWITTIKDAEMRQALTWLLESPWGGPKK